MLRNLGLMLLAGVALLGCASSPQSDHAKLQKQLDQAAAILASRNDADSLAAAALLDATWHQDLSLRLMERAGIAEPTRADLAWLHVQICALVPSCNHGFVEARLRATDPGNGVGWMGELARAVDSWRDSDVDRILYAIGHSERFDLYWTVLLSHLAPAVASTKVVSLPAAIVTVTGELSAIAIPAYRPASVACGGDFLIRESRRDSCRGVATVLQQGDTYITAMFGTSIAARVWPAGSPEALAAARTQAVNRYRIESVAALNQGLPWDMAAATRYLQLLASNRAEQDVARAELIQAKRNPDPPAN